jgi:cyclohexadienyl dehydratase
MSLLWVACASPRAREVGEGEEPTRALRIGTSGDYAPFSVAASESLERDGFDVEIARRFARDVNLAPDWIAFRWPELMADMQAGRFEVVMSGVTVRPERSVAGRFSVPVARTGAVLLVSAEWVARHPGAARDAVGVFDDPRVRIAVNAGGHLERVTRRRFGAATIIAIAGNAAVPLALASGSADAVVTDTLEAPHWLASLPGAAAFGPFTRDWKAYWVTAEDASLARRLDDWLLAREFDGSLASLRRKWLGEDAPATATPAQALLAACDERLALMPFVAGFKRAAGREIVDAAREDRVVAAGERAVARAAAAAGVPAPPPERVRRFYRAQIAAAVEVQERVIAGPVDSALARFDLEHELRPALIRIGDRMARLIVGLASDPPAMEPAAWKRRTTLELDRHGLSASTLRAIADAVAALSASDLP